MKNKQTVKVLVFGLIVLLGALFAFGMLPDEDLQGRLKHALNYEIQSQD